VSPDELAVLCGAAMPEELLTTEDLEACCFGPDAEVIGNDDAAAAFVVKEFPEYDLKVAWLLLVVVAPDVQERGRGRAVVDKVVERCRKEGVRELHTGNAAPRYVWPGVDLANTEALAFFQSLGFEAYDHGLNMLLPTSFRAPAPPGITIERETGDEAAALARAQFPNWEDEVSRGVERGTTFAARDAEGVTIAFAAHSVNRRTWIGPMATDPDRRHGGAGHALLGAVAADIEAEHRVGAAEIAWVAPIPFYAKAGAVAHRSFRMHKLVL
jgi:GNAT superfamily N-acetyltransferase